MIPDLSVLAVIALLLTCTVLLNRLVFTPVLAVMERRTQAVRDARELAESASHKAAHARGEYERTMTEARREVYREMDEKRRVALEQRSAVLARTRGEVEQDLATAQQQLASDVTAARQTLERDVDDLASAIVTRVLGRAS